MVACDRTFVNDGKLRNGQPVNNNDLYRRRHNEWLCRNDDSYRNGEPEPGSQRELADNLCGCFRYADRDGCRFVYVVACGRTFRYDGQLRHGEPGRNDCLYRNRNDAGLYGNGDFYRNGDAEPGRQCELRYDLFRIFGYADSDRSNDLQLVSGDRAFFGNRQPGDGDSCSNDNIYGHRNDFGLQLYGDFYGNSEPAAGTGCGQ